MTTEKSSNTSNTWTDFRKMKYEKTTSIFLNLKLKVKVHENVQSKK